MTQRELERELAHASTLDVLPTVCALAGVPLPADRTFDGVDLSPVVSGEADDVRDTMFYYRGSELYAVRRGSWKAHFKTIDSIGSHKKPIEHDPPLLFHLEHDAGKRNDVVAQHSDIVAQLVRLADEQRKNMKPATSQLD